jgi:uncharacterized repeat protein (TIGR01451 family)
MAEMPALQSKISEGIEMRLRSIHSGVYKIPPFNLFKRIRSFGLSLVAMSLAIGASPAWAIDIIDLSEGGTPPLGLIKTQTKLTLGLDTLNQEYQAYLDAKRRGADVEEPFTSKRTMARLVAGRVVIDAAAAGNTEDLVKGLKGLGAEITGVAGRLVSALFPLEKLPELENLSALKFARPSVAFTDAGIVTSQGDVAQYSDLARFDFDVDGASSMVGILSDSFDCSGNGSYAEDILSGDLPDGVVILEDLETGCTDEGRLMAQIVHDVAPGARLAFHTASGGEAAFSQGILDLAAIGVDIIVDDVNYRTEPMFQDGVAAQAIDQVTAMGITYFKSAGNKGRDAYEAPFSDSGLTGSLGGELHDFDPGPGVDTHLTLQVNSYTFFILQWQDPFFSVSGEPGAGTDLDICFYRLPAGIPICISNSNLGGDPIEVFAVQPGSTDLEVSIELISGPEPSLIKLIIDGDFTFVDTYEGINAGTLYGHANASGAIAVGASAYFYTPAFGEDPPILNPFSSAGNTPILFDTAGNPVVEIRQKPEFTAPDGGNNTFWGSDYEDDGWPNAFGTSASAPHAAAVAALMRQFEPSLTPAEITRVLQETVIDILEREIEWFGERVSIGEGYDNDSGAGLIDAWAALDTLSNGGACNLVALPETLDFGSILLGETSTKSVALQNTDSIPCNVNELKVSGDQFALNSAAPNVPIQIDAGASVSIPIDYTPIEPGSDDATLEVESDDPDNPEIEVTLIGEGYAIPQEADLSITLADSPDPVKLGSDLTYTIIVENLGPGTATGIIMTDELPSRVDFVSLHASQGSCSGSRTVVCNLESLEAGASAEVQIVVTPTKPGRLSNTASVEAIEDDPDSANNSATEITRVRKTGHRRADHPGKW